MHMAIRLTITKLKIIKASFHSIRLHRYPFMRSSQSNRNMYGFGSHSFISTKICMILSLKRICILEISKTYEIIHAIFLNKPQFYYQIIMQINGCTFIHLQKKLSWHSTNFYNNQCYFYKGIIQCFYTYLTPITFEPGETGTVEKVYKIITCSLVSTKINGTFVDVCIWPSFFLFTFYFILLGMLFSGDDYLSQFLKSK